VVGAGGPIGAAPGAGAPAGAVAVVDAACGGAAGVGAAGSGAVVCVDDVVAVAAAARRTVPRARGLTGWTVSARLDDAETRLLDGRGARRPARRARAGAPAASSAA
jgi:hypothetical protein